MQRIECDRDAATVCPQGRVGAQQRCAIWKKQSHPSVIEAVIDEIWRNPNLTFSQAEHRERLVRAKQGGL
jgi:hypothetical protein